MNRSTRSSYSCARCYKRKKKCDRTYPSCSQCVAANARCIGLDRDSDSELPRSLLSYLEWSVSQLDPHYESQNHVDSPPQPDQSQIGTPLNTGLSAVPFVREKAYRLASAAARANAPVSSIDHAPQHSLPYYQVFFMNAELPFPLAFQTKRRINIPSIHDGSNFTQLPEEVADKLMNFYLTHVLPQYPIFLEREMSDMFRRFKIFRHDVESVTADERFIVSMVLAIATLSSQNKDYRKLVAVAESFRRDAFSCLDFAVSSTKATTTTLQQLLLLAQYGFLFPTSTNLWQVVGDATMIALEIGLHCETPLETRVDEQVVEDRRRLYWTLYAFERSVAITSHRPFAVAQDQIRLSFCSQDDPNLFDRVKSPNENELPFIRFVDRLEFLKLQSEICSVNIGKRPIPNSHLNGEEWQADMERRISKVQTCAATSKWCNFMAWHSILLLNMPCARNPHPNESSVLRYVAAAVQIVNGYWELVDSGNLNYPWHAAHHCYEAGNLLLYGLWYHREIIRRQYSKAEVFETVHRVSGNFILLEKQWPEACECGRLFDRLRKGALSFFGNEDPADPDSKMEARNLKDLVFRENADLLYAREQSLSAARQPLFDIPMPEFDVDGLSLDAATGYLDFFNFSDPPTLDDNTMQPEIENYEQDPANFLLPSLVSDALSPNSKEPSVHPRIDEAQLNKAIARLPVCSPCKSRRIKCDIDLPSCRNCLKFGRDCRYWDHAAGRNTSRREIDTLYRRVTRALSGIETQYRNLISDPSSPYGTDSEAILRPAMSSILCDALFNAPKALDSIFFGTTSVFSRLADRCVDSIHSLEELPVATSPPTQRPILLETFSKSLVVNPELKISRSEAETLAWHYFQSVEVIFPILGQDLINSTLETVYSTSPPATGHMRTVTAQFNLIVAISLALLSIHDQGLQVVADAHFQHVLSSGLTQDFFVGPTNQSLQITLLLCVYLWLSPSTMNIWRLLGHASRMCLDIMEMQGSDKKDSACADSLYCTLYILHTQISIAFGRPHQLPDREDLPARHSQCLSPEFPSKAYNLARIQNHLHRDISASSGGRHSSTTDSAWITTFVHDIKEWLVDWNNLLDSLVDAESTLIESLRHYGKLQQCEALLLAKLAAGRRGSTSQPLISIEEETTICKDLIGAAYGLQQILKQPSTAVPPYVPHLLFPLTWTCAHAVFNAMVVLLENGQDGDEILSLLQMSVGTLAFLDGRMKCSTRQLTLHLQHMYQSKFPTTTG